jgi:protein tyrosine phosphatase (PTP) superfamily phosphohydrolase (DUF442 family)
MGSTALQQDRHLESSLTGTDWIGYDRDPVSAREIGHGRDQAGEARGACPARLTSKVLDALGRHGFDLREKLSAPVSRVPRGLLHQTKIERVMADPETIYNWRRLDDRITTSGQPTEPQLANIHALGVRHIVNLGLHTHEKALPDEAASVSRLGMTYIHIPVDFQNPTDRDFNEFCSAMERLKEVPVHVHCIANYRVSAFFYRYRRDVLGADEAQARAEMEQIWHPEGVWATFVSR